MYVYYEFIAPDKVLFFQLKSINIFSYLSMKTYVVVLLMSTNNLFLWRNKINMKLIHLIWSCEY